MGKWADFEEAEYASALYAELVDRPGNLWTPGAVFEGAIGIDAALRVSSPVFWKFIEFPVRPRGAEPGYLSALAAQQGAPLPAGHRFRSAPAAHPPD